MTATARKNKDTHIILRATREEAEAIRDKAILCGMTVSEYIRQCALGRRIAPLTDETMIRELRRLGGLLKAVHVESKGAYSEQTAEILERIKALITTLAQEISQRNDHQEG